MPVTQIPSRDPLPPSAEQTEHRDLSEAQHWESAYRGFDPDAVPHLLIQLQDDLSRARKREAAWLSVILHLLVVILLVNSEKIAALLPHRTVTLAIRTDAEREKDATFLELPPDEQKVTRRPDSKVISDKDRIATSKAPQINRQELKKILQSARPGTAGDSGQQQAPQPNQMAQNQAQQPAQQDPQRGSGLTLPRPSDPVAQLQTPPRTSQAQPNFNTSMTAGTAIEQATQAAAANHGRYGAGNAGDYGLNQGRNGANAALAPAEILTDTMGVDFSPYIVRLLHTVKQNWIASLPPAAFAPIWKQGKTSIEFTILKDGQVTGMVWHSGSGDIALDRAAWASIVKSNPLPPLPKEFPGPNFGLRLNFYLNMEITEMN